MLVWVISVFRREIAQFWRDFRHFSAKLADSGATLINFRRFGRDLDHLILATFPNSGAIFGEFGQFGVHFDRLANSEANLGHFFGEFGLVYRYVGHCSSNFAENWTNSPQTLPIAPRLGNIAETRPNSRQNSKVAPESANFAEI